jgi:hypothetical protein
MFSRHQVSHLESVLPNPLGDTASIPALISRYARIVPAFIGSVDSDADCVARCQNDTHRWP